MDPLISAAVKPLEGNETHSQDAAAILAETTDSSHPASVATASRLAIINTRIFPRFILTGIAAVMVLAAAISIQIRDIRFLPVLTGDIFDLLDIPPREPAPNITPKQHLLFGDPDLSGHERAEKLYQSDPDNPAYYAEYMVEYQQLHSELPPDFFETVARIAPNNSFFLYWAAGQIGGASLEKKASTGTYAEPRFRGNIRLSSLPTERDYLIIDQAAFEEAIALLEKAAMLPEFKSYGNDMIAARVRLLPFNYSPLTTSPNTQ